MKRFLLALVIAILVMPQLACSDTTGPSTEYDVVLPTLNGYFGAPLNVESQITFYFDAPATWPAEIEVSTMKSDDFIITGRQLEKQPYQNAFGGRVNYQYTLKYRLLTHRMSCVDLTPRYSSNGSTQLCFQVVPGIG